MPLSGLHPAVFLAMTAFALVLGEWAAFAAEMRLPPAWAFAIACALALAAWGWRWRPRSLALFMAFLAGVALASRANERLRDMVEDENGLPRRRIALDFEVEEEPRVWRDRANSRWRVAFPSHAGPVPVTVMAPADSRETAPKMGETWRCEGRLAAHGRRGGRYERRTFWVESPESARLFAPASPLSCHVFYANWSEELARRVAAGLAWCPELANLNQAILLGRRSGLSKERRQMFADAGTIHVFAISGLHVMVVAMLVHALLSKLGIASFGRNLLAIPLVWAYTALTGMRPSAVRAALMATFWMSAPIFGRRPNSLASWSATALVVYGFSPAMVFDLGCALSFSVMFGIVAWLAWSKRFRPLFGGDSAPGLSPTRFFGERGWANRFVSHFGVSFAAWIAGVPIAAAAFGRFTPGGLLANLVVIYCADWMVKIGVGGLLAGFICLPLGALLNNASAAMTWAMTAVSERVASLPLASVDVRPWNVPTCLLWYAGCAAVFFVLGRLRTSRIPIPKIWWKERN